MLLKHEAALGAPWETASEPLPPSPLALVPSLSLHCSPYGPGWSCRVVWGVTVGERKGPLPWQACSDSRAGPSGLAAFCRAQVRAARSSTRPACAQIRERASEAPGEAERVGRAGQV